MKLKVSLYQQQYAGTPLTTLDDPILVDWNEGEPWPAITKAIVSLLRNNISQLEAPEVVDMVERNGIESVLNLNELNAYLTHYAGLRVFVNGTTSDIIPELAETDFTIMVLTPANGMFKMRTDYVSNEQDFSIREIVSDVIAKFGIGRGLVPVNDLSNLARGMEDMAAKGLPMTEMFQNSLINQLAEYDCEVYFIYQ